MIMKNWMLSNSAKCPCGSLSDRHWLILSLALTSSNTKCHEDKNGLSGTQPSRKHPWQWCLKWVLSNFNGCNCSVMATWFLVVSNWFNFEVCRIVTNTDEESLYVGLPAAARYASHFLTIVLQPREIFCPAPDKISFSTAATGLWSVPFITSFPFWAGGIYRLRIWARGHQKPLISIEDHGSASNHLSLKYVMARLGSSPFS